MRRREMAGCGHPLPFAAAAGLALGLALFAHQLLLTLAAVVIGPLPAVQTALYLSRKDLSENAAQAVSEPAQKTQAEPAQEAPALPAGDMEAYLVPLEGDEARPEGAGAILEKNYPQGSGEKYIPCGSGSIKNNTSVSSADIAAEITNPLPFAVEWNSPDPQILIMHTHATEDYRLSAGLWYRPGDGSRTHCMARPGIILYGFDPSDEVRFGIFRPVMKLKTIVSMVKEMEPGQSASYGRRFTAEKPTKVATLCAGYADGYPRLLSCGKGIVEIKGMPCPVLGRVCMDQMMVDVSALPDVQEGDEAILWGGEVSDSAETIAHKTDTISYEVLCGVSRRVPRVYLENGGIKAVEDWIL